MKWLTYIKPILLMVTFLSQNETFGSFRCEILFSLRTEVEWADILNTKSSMIYLAVGRRVSFISENGSGTGILKAIHYGETNWTLTPPSAEIFVTIADEQNLVILEDVSLKKFQNLLAERSITLNTNPDLGLIFPLIKKEFYSRHEASTFQKNLVQAALATISKGDSTRWQKLATTDLVQDTTATPDRHVIENFKKMQGRKIIGVQIQSRDALSGENEVISFEGTIIEILNFSKSPDQWPFWKIKIQTPFGVIWVDASGPQHAENIYFIKAD
jgi:hypothetical protein